jgi:class 3 adenylate cyclase
MVTIGPKIERTLPWRSAVGWRPAVALEPRSAGRDGLFAWLPRHVSIRLALAATFGVIIAVTATALILALESGRQNTIDLVRDRSDRIIGTILERTRLHLEPARDQSRFIAGLVADGTLDPRDDADFTSHLSVALAGTPQVSALAVIRTDLRQLRVERQGDAVVARSLDMKTVPGLQEAFEMAKNAGQPLWGELLWSARLSQPLVNIRTPLWRQGSFIGILLTTVTVTELSAFLADSEARRSAGAFILYGREQVLAHTALARAPSLFKPDRPLPAIAEVGDPVLAAIWGPQRNLGTAATILGASAGHVVDVNGIPYIFLYRELSGYSDRPWLIGRYMPLEELGSEVRRLERATWIGLASVLAAVAGAWLVGYAVGQPILRLARATAAIRDLDLSSARPLVRSGLRELDEAIRAYNALIATLRWFETYVPRNLVKRLMAQGDRAAALEERVVTVLFTDIADFTSLAERLTASEAAAFLNEHFGLLADCVEAEGGTIDKFIGDSLMAFWGAPEAQPDHAARACRAARAIAATIVADNRSRREQGLEPVRIRVGLHTGPTIVGNIGAPGRINYTIVGDTVNMAQRIENVAKQSMTEDDEAVVLVSEAVLQSADISLAVRPIGRHTLRGRQEPTEIFRLL